MGHDPELVAQPGPEEGGPDPPVHPATETARSAKATAVTAIPRRHRKRTVGLTLKYHRIDRNAEQGRCCVVPSPNTERASSGCGLDRLHRFTRGCSTSRFPWPCTPSSSMQQPDRGRLRAAESTAADDAGPEAPPLSADPCRRSCLRANLRRGHYDIATEIPSYHKAPRHSTTSRSPSEYERSIQIMPDPIQGRQNATASLGTVNTTALSHLTDPIPCADDMICAPPCRAIVIGDLRSWMAW